MSKKNSRGQQAKSEESDLPNLSVAQAVAVELPEGVESRQQSLPLLEGYLRAKMNNKRVAQGQALVLVFKGREETFRIAAVEGAKETTHKSATTTAEGKQCEKEGTAYVIGSATQLRLVRREEHEAEKGGEEPAAYFGYKEEARDLQQSILYSLFQR
jgi:hypothetical protein